MLAPTRAYRAARAENLSASSSRGIKNRFHERQAWSLELPATPCYPNLDVVAKVAATSKESKIAIFAYFGGSLETENG
jgi:hypothetical protein